MNFQRLIEARENFNLRQKDIVDILGITQQFYFLWENGSKIIPCVIGLSNIKYYNITNKEIDKILIGERSRKIRKDKNITQEELVDILNTTHPTISAYESGKSTILTAFAYEICKKYNISMDYLCGRIN